MERPVRKNILITAVGNMGVGAQILKAIRLEHVSADIIGTDILDICTQEKEVDYFYQVPRCKDEELYKRRIDEIIEKHNVAIVFVGAEQELSFFAKYRKEYKERGIYLAINSDEIIHLCAKKSDLYSYLNAIRVTIPKYVHIKSIKDCEEVDFYPVVLKPNRDSGGSKNVYIAFDEEDLRLMVSYLLKRKIDIVAQEYIGNAECEYTIGVTSDENGNVLGSIILRRILKSTVSINQKYIENEKEYVISSGISQGYIVHDETIRKQAEEIARIVKSRGAINIQCRIQDGRIGIMEINPRISGSVYARALAGYNEPICIINKVLFNKTSELSYKDILVLRNIKEEIMPYDKK